MARCCPATPATGTRSGSSAGSASRARGWRCCSTRCACSRRPGPDLRLLVVGRGDPDALRRDAGPELAERLDILGGVDDATKAAALRSMDVYCAPNTGGESFGMVLTEAMAAGHGGAGQRPRRVPRGAGRDDGSADAGSGSDGPGTAAGVLFPTGDARGARLRRWPRCSTTRSAGPRSVPRPQARAAAFDWPVVAADVLRVYRAAIAADPRRVPGRTVAGTR